MDQNTTVFKPQKDESRRVKEIPVSQIIGYILSGDPTYITSHQNARALICKIERDDLLQEMIKKYLDL